MLNKNGVMLDIKPVSEGAWINRADKVGKTTVGISIRHRTQYFYLHAENRNETLLHYWNYREFIKAILNPLDVNYRQLHPESAKALIALHDNLIAAHIPAFVQLLLRAQLAAGCSNYTPINAGIAEQLSPFILRDVQSYKIAAAILQETLKFQTGHQPNTGSYLGLVESSMKNWRGLLSYKDEGKSYHALNATIDNWTGKVPPTILRLKEFRLERPLHAAAVRLLLYVPEAEDSFSVEERANLIHVIQHTPLNDITMLLKMPQIRGGNGARRTDGPSNLIHYIRDGMRLERDSYEHIPSLMIMWNRAFRAHEEDERRRENQRRIQMEAKRKGEAEWMKTPTMPLPYDLPELKEEGAAIRFLATVGDCHEESYLMNHCIHSYSQSAVNGDCYLFHIDYKGEMASAEVLPSGVINQVRGPRNAMNSACDYAREILSAWVRSDWTKKKKKQKAPA